MKCHSFPSLSFTFCLGVALLTVPRVHAEEVPVLDLSDLETWRFTVTNDGVMGGLSEGAATRTEEGNLQFSGNLSLKNNGGFSSVWLQKTQKDLSEARGVSLTVMGDGRTYHLQIETDVMHRGERVSFQAPFDTTAGEWVTVRVPFDQLVPTWRGDRLEDSFDPAKVTRFGVILLERSPGPFQLTLAKINSY